jgi:hypothetical protein
MLGLAPLASRPVAAAFEPDPGGLAAETGVFTLSGQDVALRPAWRLLAATGVFTLTGQDVAFILSLSSAALNRIALVGSTSLRIFGFVMIQNFNMTAGDTKTLVVTVRDAEGTAVNLTGSTIKWQAKRSLGKAASLSKVSASGITLTDPTNGEFSVALDPSDTEDLVGLFHHEAEVTAADGTISTVLRGTMKINRALIEAT